MVRRRNVRAEDSDDEREGDRGDRSRRRDRASAVAKRRQTPSPPPAVGPNATLDGGCEAANGAPGSTGVGLSKEDFDAIPPGTRKAIVGTIDKVRKLDDGFRELAAILDKCLDTDEQDHPEIPEDLFDVLKALEGYRLLTDVCAEGAKRGLHPRDVFANLPDAFISEIGLNPIALLEKVTDGMPKALEVSQRGLPRSRRELLRTRHREITRDEPGLGDEGDASRRAGVGFRRPERIAEKYPPSKIWSKSDTCSKVCRRRATETKLRSWSVAYGT